MEALSKNVVDVYGAWVCAEVINSGPYTCTVKYGSHDGIMEEAVPRRAVRPLPPPLEGFAKFTPGDLVECCHDFSWKTARILNAVTDNNFLVLLLGDDIGLVVHRSFLRVRQRWTGGGWCVVGKNTPAGYMEKRMYACAKRTPCEDFCPIKKKNLTAGLYTMKEMRIRKCAKRTPCPDYFPIKKGQKRRRLDEDCESLASNSVGDQVVGDCRADQGNESECSDAESVFECKGCCSLSPERRISLDLNIVYIPDHEDFASIM